MKNSHSARDVSLDVINDILKFGSGRVGDVLSSADLDVLRFEATSLLDSIPHRGRGQIVDSGAQFYKDENVTILENFVVSNPKIAAILSKVLEDRRVKKIIETIYGGDYILWSIVLRRSEPGGRSLGFHQDGRGSCIVSIGLDDGGRWGGTFYLPGSHRFPFDIREAGACASPSFFLPFGESLQGGLGSVNFLLGRTWHGRYANSRATPSTAFWLAFTTSTDFTGSCPAIDAKTLSLLPSGLKHSLTVPHLRSSTRLDGPAPLISLLEAPSSYTVGFVLIRMYFGAFSLFLWFARLVRALVKYRSS